MRIMTDGVRERVMREIIMRQEIIVDHMLGNPIGVAIINMMAVCMYACIYVCM